MVRESGMPEQRMWESFFDVEGVLEELQFTSASSTLELGAGYGTFSVSAARRSKRFVTCELNEEMARSVQGQLANANVSDFSVFQLDFVDELNEATVGVHDAVLLFNIMHMVEPIRFLANVRAVLKEDSLVYVIHWRSDIETPRGPPLLIRTKPEQCAEWFAFTGFELIASKFLQSAPYHFGQVFRFPRRDSHS
jgi:cyclopropane fatty-acyl-phospholipid synthase-like methyltransferase